MSAAEGTAAGAAPRPVPGPPVPGPPVPGPPAMPVQLAQAEQRLAALGGLPPAEQVAGFDEVHRLLQDALAALDDAGA